MWPVAATEGGRVIPGGARSSRTVHGQEARLCEIERKHDASVMGGVQGNGGSYRETKVDEHRKDRADRVAKGTRPASRYIYNLCLCALLVLLIVRYTAAELF